MRLRMWIPPRLGKKHWLIFGLDGELLMLSNDKAASEDEQRETPGSLLCECACAEPLGHLEEEEEEEEC